MIFNWKIFSLFVIQFETYYIDLLWVLSVTVRHPIFLIETILKIHRNLFGCLSDLDDCLMERVHQITIKFGMALLLLTRVIDLSLITQYWLSNISQKLFRLLKMILVLIVFYLLLLTLWGYRSYRNFILRADKQMPTSLAFITYYGISSIVVF